MKTLAIAHGSTALSVASLRDHGHIVLKLYLFIFYLFLEQKYIIMKTAIKNFGSRQFQRVSRWSGNTILV